LKIAILEKTVLALNPSANVDPQSLFNNANCYLCAGVWGVSELFKLALYAQLVGSVNSSQAVDPQTLLNASNCYSCGSNAALGDLFELGLLYFYASTSGSASAILMENSGYILTETGGHILLG
jgi:hypothetical protein